MCLWGYAGDDVKSSARISTRLKTTWPDKVIYHFHHKVKHSKKTHFSPRKLSTVFDIFYRDKFGHTDSHWRGPKLDSKNTMDNQIWLAGVGHLYNYISLLFVPGLKNVKYLWLHYLCIDPSIAVRGQQKEKRITWYISKLSVLRWVFVNRCQCRNMTPHARSWITAYGLIVFL